MSRSKDQFLFMTDWPAPAHWRMPERQLPNLQGAASGHLGLLARLVRAIVRADTRYRDALRFDRLCDRMRRDIGLPAKGSDANRLERQALEWRRWN